MSKGQIALYAAILFLAYCEEEQIPLGPLLNSWALRFWSGLASFAGTQALKSESRYYREVYRG